MRSKHRTFGHNFIAHDSCGVLAIDGIFEEQEGDGVGYQHVCCVTLEWSEICVDRTGQCTVKDAREIGSCGGYADSAWTIAARANKTAARYLESATIPIVIATCQISKRLFVDRDHTMQ